ncbi:hypothetical protein [Yinghuangia sp. YIM S09857]|uniref:hypothetical protein n=1 Tax=Yinghuangia sp. YIM S09857 TaxID=3436929 RepID=UPI003F537607
MTVTVEGDNRGEEPGAGRPPTGSAVPRLYIPAWWEDGPTGALDSAAQPGTSAPDLLKRRPVSPTPAPPVPVPAVDPPVTPQWTPAAPPVEAHLPPPRSDDFAAPDQMAGVFAPDWDPELDGRAAAVGHAAENSSPEGLFGEWTLEETEENYSFVPPKRRPWLPMALVGVAVLALVGVGVVVLTSGDKKKAAPPPASNSPLPATALPPDQSAAFRATHVTLASHEGRLQVTWDAPSNTQGLSGYIVVSQTQGGELIEHILAEKDQHQVVFTGPAAAAGVCAVVTTLIDDQPAMKLARGDAVCTTPGPPVASQSVSPSTTPTGGSAPSASGSTSPPASEEE